MYEPSALMTLPKAASDLLIVAPSFSLDRLASALTRSLFQHPTSYYVIHDQIDDNLT